MAKKDATVNDASESAAPPPGPLKKIGWMLLAGGWLFLLVALATYQPADWPSHAVAPQNWPVENLCGPAGAWTAYQAYLLFGPGVWLLIVGWAGWLGVTAAGRTVRQLPLRIIGLVVCAVAASGFVALQIPDAGAMPEGAGGLAAIYLVEHLVQHFAVVGSMLVLLAIFGVGAVVAADELVVALPAAMIAAARKASSVPWPRPVLVGLPSRLAERLRANRDSGATLRPKPAPATSDHPGRADGRSGAIDAGAGGLGGTESFDPDAYPVDEDEPDAEPTRPTGRTRRPAAGDSADAVRTAVVGAPQDEDEAEEEDAEAYDEADLDAEAEAEGEDYEIYDEDEDEDQEETDDEVRSEVLDPDALREKIKKLPISFAQTAQSNSPPPAPPQDLSGYKFPGYDVLVEPEHHFNDEMAALVREQAEILERALQTYKIDAEVVAIDAGPVITLYEVSLAPGTKVAQLNNISSDVARELKAQNIRIVPNTAGKSTVGIEVPNLKKEKVRLKELMTLGGEKARKEMRLPMYLGKDASGEPLIQDLATMPHMLIAGTTGSGKSVCMNSIIMSFLLTRRPDELKLILVDPKMVEMAQFKDIPHLMCPVVTEMGKAAAILEWAVTKMDERYELLAEAGCRDIDSYNQLSREEQLEMFEPTSEAEEAKIPKKLPRIVFVIDELADLMMTNKEVESHIVRIAQKARAVGIHLILATQRPQANVVTGLIKSNMPCRVSFKVSSGMDSRIVLDQKGAELLLGQGDMLFLSPRTSKLVRAQGTLVDDAEIRKSVRFLRDVAEPSFEPQLVQLKSADADGGEQESGPRDELFEDAVEIVLETQRGSVSLLQRRLAIGYSRASRLVEEMAEAGIIGSYKGSQAREVTMTLEEWEAMREQMARDAEIAAKATAGDQPDNLGETSWDDDDGVPEEYDDEYRN